MSWTILSPSYLRRLGPPMCHPSRTDDSCPNQKFRKSKAQPRSSKQISQVSSMCRTIARHLTEVRPWNTRSHFSVYRSRVRPWMPSPFIRTYLWVTTRTSNFIISMNPLRGNSQPRIMIWRMVVKWAMKVSFIRRRSLPDAIPYLSVMTNHSREPKTMWRSRQRGLWRPEDASHHRS